MLAKVAVQQCHMILRCNDRIHTKPFQNLFSRKILFSIWYQYYSFDMIVFSKMDDKQRVISQKYAGFADSTPRVLDENWPVISQK